MNVSTTKGNSEAADTLPNSAPTAAEIYRVRSDYRRFNQKFNITRQRLWSPELKQLTREREGNLTRLVAERKPGYGHLDLAFYLGSGGNLENTGFSINAPNVRGNSWGPLTKSFDGGIAVKYVDERPDWGSNGRQPLEEASPRRWRASPAEASQALRRVGCLFGASRVAFAPLDRRWVFSHYFDEETKQDYPIKFTDEPGYEHYTEPGMAEDRALVIPKEVRYAVVMLLEMDEEGIARAPTAIELATVRMAYSRISFVTVMVAEFIRGLGYHAIPSANCTALSMPLAIDAGLGELGRNAKLITPKFGPRCRIAKVLTDLPVETGAPRLFGVTEFCNGCKKCARHCPAQAIPYGERSFDPVNECNNAGVLQWQVNHKKCAEFCAKVATNCGICIRVCPFNKGHHAIHDATRAVIKNAPWLDPWIVRLDDALGFGRLKSPETFWRRTPHGE
ncbi:MAG: reductive dehalogenase [Chloroflexi bacterium]|nr:reductive dehalogenase [Chloroflexota bacterium]